MSNAVKIVYECYEREERRIINLTNLMPEQQAEELNEKVREYDKDSVVADLYIRNLNRVVAPQTENMYIGTHH